MRLEAPVMAVDDEAEIADRDEDEEKEGKVLEHENSFAGVLSR